MTPAHHPLAALLAELGWRPEQLARQVNALAAGHGRSERIHPKTPYKWLDGAQPRSPWLAFIPLALSEALQREVTAADLSWPAEAPLPVPASEGLLLPWTAEGGLRAARVVLESVIMDRRLFLTLAGAAMTAPAHEWLIAAAVSNTGQSSGRQVPLEVVDQLDAITGSLRRMDDQLGGRQILGLTRQHLATVTGLLRNHRYTDAVGRRLHATAAELLRLGGWLSFDDGNHPQAQRYWIAALHASHAAGDRALGANILGFMSCQAKDIGQIREAVTLAETARASYPGASPRVSAILDLRAAEAYANERSASDCRRALDSAFSHLAGPPAASGDPGWSYWADDAQAHAQAGYCYLKLEDWQLARKHLRAAIRHQDSEHTREGALRDTLLATTYASQQQPDLDQALHLGQRAVQTLTGQVSSARCSGHVTRLTATLTPYRGNPAVRAFIADAGHLLARPRTP